MELPEELQKLQRDVNAKLRVYAAMIRDYTAPCAVAIGQEESTGRVRQAGTGTLIKAGDHVVLLSNNHVLSKKDVTLAVTLKNGRDAHVLQGSIPRSADADLALTAIDPAVRADTDRTPLPLESLASVGEMRGEDIVFFHGFPEESHSFFSVVERALRSTSFPYSGQTLPAIADDWVFYINVDFATMRDEKGQPVKPFDLAGISGSLVWNTRLVETVRAGEQWTLDRLQPVGVVRGWSEKHKRVEAVHLCYAHDLIVRGLPMITA